MWKGLTLRSCWSYITWDSHRLRYLVWSACDDCWWVVLHILQLSTTRSAEINQYTGKSLSCNICYNLFRTLSYRASEPATDSWTDPPVGTESAQMLVCDICASSVWPTVWQRSHCQLRQTYAGSIGEPQVNRPLFISSNLRSATSTKRSGGDA